MRLLVVNARLITMADPTDPLPATAPPTYLDNGWMHVVDGRIAALGDGEPPWDPDAEVLDVAGSFVAPGFVSSHSHLFTSGARGLGVDQTLYGWCSAMFGLINHATPDEFYWCTLHGVARLHQQRRHDGVRLHRSAHPVGGDGRWAAVGRRAVASDRASAAADRRQARQRDPLRQRDRAR